MNELKIILSDFEGPLDLLLHLIKESKIDIYDIPISKITDQYMNFLNKMENLKLDIAGDYLVMAATLMSIKSKMLLPKIDYDDDNYEIEELDPREDLISQLLTYQVYKNVSYYFGELEKNRLEYFSKEMSIPKENKLTLKPNLATTDDLVRTISNILKSSKKQMINPLFVENITIEELEKSIYSKLENVIELKFSKLLIQNKSSEEIVTAFMAILELMKLKKVLCIQNDLNSDFIVKLRGESDEQ